MNERPLELDSSILLLAALYAAGLIAANLWLFAF